MTKKNTNIADNIDEWIAELAHEVNRAYCSSIGDDSQPAWKDAPDWAKKSALTGVNFHRQYPNAGPHGSHDSWLREKKADGWKYGPVKDPEKKEHPCYLPYGDLPPEQRSKDYIFTAIVKHCIRD